MDEHPELRRRLADLDQEYEDGELTKKGYEKRRTLLLSEFLGPNPAEPVDPATGVAVPPTAPLPAPSPSFEVAAERINQRENTNSLHALHFDFPTSVPPLAPAQYGGNQLNVPIVEQGRSSLSSRDGQSDQGASQDNSRSHSMIRSDYAFNPAELEDVSLHQLPPDQPQAPIESRMSTMLDNQSYFQDFTGQQMDEQHRDSYGGPHRYSNAEAISPKNIPPLFSGNDGSPLPIIDHLMPLEPRDIPFNIFDPHNPNIQMSQFNNMGAVLRHRGKTNPKQIAFWVLDSKGKETTSITWDKLASKAEKVAQVIRDRSNLYRGDRVALVYRDTEIIEFAIALLGCFIAGVVAVPINCIGDYNKLSLLLTTTMAHLALTTDYNLKSFHRDITQSKLKWPTGVEWWKTNEFGSYHPKKKDEPPVLQLPDLAYIEFSRAPTGDLRGVVLSHRTIMHQMACISAIITSIPNASDTFNRGLRDSHGEFITRTSRHGETILSYLEPREGIGMILGVLFGVYGGHTTVWTEPAAVETAGLYAHLITKYRASIMVADYSRLKFAAYNYQQDPMTTRQFKKGMDPNFSSVKLCLIDALSVDAEFHELLADRWFKPMRNDRARDVIAPMLCLPEHGGMIISVRDWLGGEERMGCPLSVDEAADIKDANGDELHNRRSPNMGPAAGKRGAKADERAILSEVLLDKESLKQNDVVVVATGEEARRRGHEAGTVRIGAFGFPIPDATLAVVDPETSLLCSPYSVGEIWVDSPSLSGGFWSLPKHTETIFHARPFRFAEGSPTPAIVDIQFLRTGLLGCVIEGKIYVLGLYEDRIRQKVEWVEHGVQDTEHRYFFVQHLISSIMRNIPKIHDCSAFDVYVNGEYLPIILIETLAASTSPIVPGGPPRQLDIPILDSLSERCMDVLLHEHHLRTYCVLITAPNALPRVIKNGRKEIGNMLCRREFDNGTLPCVHVRFGVDRAVQNLPVGDDPSGGIWSPMSSHARQQMFMMSEKQYSGVDHREFVKDDRDSSPLNQFSNIHDLLQWRVSRHPEELAYISIDSRLKEGKAVPWKKFDLKVAAVAIYLKNKVKLVPGDHVLLMYTHSEEFVYAIHACFVLGVVAVPMGPIDAMRLNEDAPAMLSMIADFKIKAILVNNDTDSLLKQKAVAQHLKQSAMILRVSVPNTYNTTKPSKQSHGCRDLGLTIRPAWVRPSYPVLIWVYWSPDQRRTAVQLGHKTLMELCKVQKETCQMGCTRPIMACVRSTIGLGFIHMCLMGIYLAAPTYLVSPVDYANNPAGLFQTLSRYKIKDTYATSQMLDHAIAHMTAKGFTLHELKNFMISAEGRPRLDVYGKVLRCFGPAGLDRTAINTIYSHVLNPMIASRSYMCIEPIEISLDTAALRRGIVSPVDPAEDPFALTLQDSGMVPVSTQISIVNPETNRLCHIGEYGEIWVQSDACVYGFYGSKDPLDIERFNGRTVDGDPNARYVRTGDLGFLHTVSRPIGPGNSPVEMQILFLLGNVGETFDVNGLSHFPMDIEASVERCHRNIAPNGCAVFQAGGLVVVLVEVIYKNFLASIVPVIVNSVLNAHQIVIDIVAFVSRGDFPRSRLGEKQRGKILGSWVQRKMRTIAQFSIKEGDGMDADPQIRHSGASFRTSSARASSGLQHVESSSQLAHLEEQEYSLPLDISELPAMEQDASANDSALAESHERDSQDTPTGPVSGHVYSPIDTPETQDFYRTTSIPPGGSRTPDFANSFQHSDGRTLKHGPSDVHEAFIRNDDDFATPPAEPGVLRLANPTLNEDEDEWGEDAMRRMKLAGSASRT